MTTFGTTMVPTLENGNENHFVHIRTALTQGKPEDLQ
jgi:hypothetical protein